MTLSLVPEPLPLAAPEPVPREAAADEPAADEDEGALWADDALGAGGCGLGRTASARSTGFSGSFRGMGFSTGFTGGFGLGLGGASAFFTGGVAGLGAGAGGADEGLAAATLGSVINSTSTIGGTITGVSTGAFRVHAHSPACRAATNSREKA